MRDYTEIAVIERNGFDIIVDRTWEDINPRDHFDDSDIDEICEKIDNGTYEWFMLRVRVLLDGHEFGSHYLGGCLYEDPKEVMNDGVAEDCIHEAMREAAQEIGRLREKLMHINLDTMAD